MTDLELANATSAAKICLTLLISEGLGKVVARTGGTAFRRAAVSLAYAYPAVIGMSIALMVEVYPDLLLSLYWFTFHVRNAIQAK